MTNYKFFDDETGEEFFVQEETFEKAKEIAKSYFDRPIYQGEYSDEEGEWMGLDTY